jgi:hypothetical protein
MNQVVVGEATSLPINSTLLSWVKYFGDMTSSEWCSGVKQFP